MRLPADPALRYAQVKALNEKADGAAPIPLNSVAWVIDRYKESDEYLSLKKGSLKYYNRFLNDLEKTFGPLPFKEAMTRRVAVDWVRSFKKSVRRQAGAVLVNVYNAALYHNCATINYAHKLNIRGGSPRETYYTDEQCRDWLAACGDDAMALTFTILRYAVQRPGDVLGMRWAQYDGDTIKLRQEKTGKLVEVPCHAALKSSLDAARGNAKTVFIVSNGYRRLSYSRFQVRFRNIADAAGLPKHQARDLRRTAAVMMSEAGATVQQISAIAGW